MLQDLDRPIVEYEYEPWGRSVKMRVLSAGQFVQVMSAMSAAPDDDNAAKIQAMAKVCSLGILDPPGTAEEWADGVTLETLMHLGNRVLSTTSQSMQDVSKKN